MQLDRIALIGFLEEVDKELDKTITLVAVGGTAMALLRVKASTIDTDFTLPGKDYDEFQKALRNTPHGFTVHCWKDGIVFSQMLPDDYSLDSEPLQRSTILPLTPPFPSNS